MSDVLKFLFPLFLASALSSVAIAEPADQEVAEKIDVMVQNLTLDIADLSMLSEQIQAAEGGDVEALRYRRDGRTFELLSHLDALVAKVAKQPNDDSVRAEVEQLLSKDIATIGDAIFTRLDELDHRIVSSNETLGTLSGGAHISMQAYISSLESIRFHYYEALINHFDSRETLGLPSAKLRERLEAALYLHTEKLVGQVEYSTATQSELQSQLELDPENTDLDATLRGMVTQHKAYISRLGRATELLERLGVDTAEYKAILLKDSGDFSIGLFETGVMKSLLGDWTAVMREAMVAKTPDVLFRVVVFIAILLLFRYLSRLTKSVVKRSCESSSLDLSTLLKDILISGSGGIVMVLGIFMALSQIGISLGPMLAGLGVAGFVIGFALQDTLGNFASGAMILIYRPYDVDDFIEVTGASGLVKKMNLVSTTITTFDNQTLVVPNSKIWGDVIKNVTAQKVRRVDLEFGVGYDDDIEHVERVLNDIVATHELTLKKPEALIKLHSLGDSSVNLIVRPWTKTEHYWDVYWDLMREVKMRFDREGISIPFPQRDVHHYPQADDPVQGS